MAISVQGTKHKDRTTSEPLYKRAHFGAYADNEPWTGTSHADLETLVGAQLKRESWFMDFGAGWQSTPANAAAATGHDIMIAWQPASGGTPIPFSDILAGTWDSALTSWFTSAKNYAGTVIFRPFWEMNANAAAYSMAYTGADKQVTSTAQFISTWRYIVNLQRSVGGTNIRWFFCANGSDVGAYPVESYYPGDAYVDEVGFDTYNETTYASWTSFDDKLAPMYARVTALNSVAPVTIGELGSIESVSGETKATWSTNMFLSLQFPRLRTVCFFNAIRGIDWRLNSSSGSLSVYQQYLPLAS